MVIGVLVALQGAAQTDGVVMTIRGFDYLKSDSVTGGSRLNNPEILDTIVSYLKTYPSTNIELHYHGSCRSSSTSYWNDFTEIRAYVCKEYIVSKGIDETRITAIGKGIDDLIVDCNCKECSEEDFIRNHRLVIIKTE